jgi:chemotaxis protein MotB
MAIEPVAYDPDPPESDVIETEAENPDEALEQFEQQVRQTVSEKVKNDFSIRWNQKRLVLVLGERIAFNVGEADLLSDFQPTLKRIAGFISSRKGYKVTVAGHTDDTPINNTRFPSNWELSAIRAVNVAKFMILNGVDPHRIYTEGYSAYRPLQPNTTDHNRHANRRVEITLIKAQENEKQAEEKVAISTSDASMKSTQAVNLPIYPQKRYHTSRGYPF